MADLLTGAQLAELCMSAQHAFRLETRDRYNEPGEQEPFRRWTAGDPDEEYLWGDGDPWFAAARRAADEGRPVRRVRVVTVPLGEYSQYALWSAQGNIAAGEDIRWLARAQAGALGLPVAPPVDAWLLDGRVAELRFDAADRLLGAELRDDAQTVAAHERWRDVAWAHAQTREAFLQTL
jgi:hypothetical protein